LDFVVIREEYSPRCHGESPYSVLSVLFSYSYNFYGTAGHCAHGLWQAETGKIPKYTIKTIDNICFWCMLRDNGLYPALTPGDI
jgi:hypothetical protein